ncbi:cell division control protein Cdc6 [halophilic archaeon]|nr:cell division control protein Cdc6 [halophilic archaeon]
MPAKTNYFGADESIFAEKSLLRVSHLPNEDRIIGRDDELHEIGNCMQDGLQGEAPTHAMIYGKTGTGKSLCSKFICEDLVDRAESNNVNAGYVYIDCTQQSTETKVCREMAHTLNDEETTDISVPYSGISTADYYRRLWDILDQLYNIVVVILDEIDRLDGDDILYQLSRARESGKMNDAHIGIIGISNKMRYEEKLNQRVKSSFSKRDIVFSPYDADQIREILENRSDAFYDDVLNEGVIPKVAAISAQEHGDARKAIDILRYAGEVVDNSDGETVTEEHVDMAQEREQEGRIRELIESSPNHSKFALHSIARLSLRSEKKRPEVEGSDVYEMYESICEERGSDPLTQRRLRDILDEMKFLGIINRERKSKGREGAYTTNRLLEDPEMVLRACSEM